MPYLCFFAKTSAEALFFFTLSRGETFRRYSGSPLEAKSALSQGAKSGRLRRPGGVGAHRQGQKGTGHHMVSCPLLTPLTFLCAATPFGRAAKRGLRGLGSVRRFAFGTLLGPEFTLRDWQRCQCAARRCRALDLRCEKLRFHQAFCLGAPNVTVGPSLLDARPKGVASKGR